MAKKNKNVRCDICSKLFHSKNMFEEHCNRCKQKIESGAIFTKKARDF